MHKSQLLKPRLTEDEVEIPGVGTVRVRALSRAEALLVNQLQERKGYPAAEVRILALGLVDPVLTEDEVRQWQDGSPGGECEPVVTRITQLSGMIKEDSKSDLPGDGVDPGPGIRVLPGDEAGEDGPGATPDDDRR